MQLIERDAIFLSSEAGLVGRRRAEHDVKEEEGVIAN